MFTQIPNIPYSNIHGVLEAVQPLEKVAIKTKIGSLIPIYKVEDQGRKRLTPVKIDTCGKVKSLQLQEATTITTTVGDLSAEFVTFYQSGNVRRLFPLNGKLSGYWSEENEYNIAKTINIPTSIGTIKVKPIYVHFYESGELKSITFWPKERVEIDSPIGLVKIKTGISFYKLGQIKSFEPDSPITIKSPIGNIEAYDPDPVGINGEKNSLTFRENGDIETISTIHTGITVIDKYKIQNTFSPYLQSSRCSDSILEIKPLIIEFRNKEVIFKHGFKTIGNTTLSSIYALNKFEVDESVTEKSSCH